VDDCLSPFTSRIQLVGVNLGEIADGQLDVEARLRLAHDRMNLPALSREGAEETAAHVATRPRYQYLAQGRAG
jgi:hypothetical protein